MLLNSGQELKNESKIKELLAYLHTLELKFEDKETTMEKILNKINPDLLFIIYFYINEVSFQKKFLPNSPLIRQTKSQILKSIQFFLIC